MTRSESAVHDGDPIIRRLGERAIRVDDGSLSTSLLSSFPLAAGRIDWTKVPGALLREAPPERAAGANLGPGTLDTRAYVEQVKQFFSECVLRAGATAEDWVVYVGDNGDCEYRVQLGAVGELLDEIADVPEHKYFFPPDASWCFLWSFGDDLHFGKRPPGKLRGGNRDAGRVG
jgi:hypothetical protein